MESDIGYVIDSDGNSPSMILQQYRNMNTLQMLFDLQIRGNAKSVDLNSFYYGTKSNL